MMPDREKYIEVFSKAVKTVKEFNEDTPIKISLQCMEDILAMIKEQPEIIRCKDCKHGTRCTNGAKLPAVQCFNSDNGEFGYCHEPSWFCADGE